jgi:hypothetical protein
MIFSFSEAGIACLALPPPSRFFEDTIFQGQVGNHLLESRGLAPQILHLVRGRRLGCVTSQALLASLKKIFRPPIIEVLPNPLAAAKLRDAVFAAQAFQTMRIFSLAK